jgi:MoxR-like ATPase
VLDSGVQVGLVSSHHPAINAKTHKLPREKMSNNYQTNIPSVDVEGAIRIALTLQPGITMLLMGDSGIGKSAIPVEVARRHPDYTEEDVIDLRTASLSDGDTLGIPDLDAMAETGETSYAPPAWLMRASRQPTILFLDELNRGQISIQNQFFQLVYDNELSIVRGGKAVRLHPKTRIFAAINVGNNYTGISEMDIALQRRFFPVTVTARLDSWINFYASKPARAPLPRKITTVIPQERLDSFKSENNVVEHRTLIRYKDEERISALDRAKIAARSAEAKLNALTVAGEKKGIPSAVAELETANANLFSAMEVVSSSHPKDQIEVTYLWSDDYDHSQHPSRVDGLIVEFISKHPDLFHSMENVNFGGVNIFPNPASWTRCSDSLRAIGAAPEDNAGKDFEKMFDAHNIILGYLGTVHGRELISYITSYVGLISPIEYFFEESDSATSDNQKILTSYYARTVHGSTEKVARFERTLRSSFIKELIRRSEEGEHIPSKEKIVSRFKYLVQVFSRDIIVNILNDVGIGLSSPDASKALQSAGWTQKDVVAATSEIVRMAIKG